MAEIILSAPNDLAGAIALDSLRNRGERTHDFRYLRDLSTALPGARAAGILHELPVSFHLMEARDEIAEPLIRDFLGLHSDPAATSGERGFLFSAEPNWDHSFCAPPGGAPALQADHSTYLSQLNVPAAHRKANFGKSGHIALIDTGCDGVAINDFYDLLHPTSHHPGTSAATDKVGHGTAMATLIREVAPDCTLTVIRTSDSATIPLWHLLGAIVLAVFDARAEIINLSLGLANITGTCTRCGASSAARGFALEFLMKALLSAAPARLAGGHPPTFAAATGNDGSNGGFFLPARYDSALAVGSVNKSGQRSNFSTYGTYLHAHYLMAPGGETSGSTPTEWAIADNAQEFYGTSIACAYTSGLLALLRTDDANSDLRTLAIGKVVGSAPASVCGSGQIQYS